jgi:5-methylcytosine-specific restriction endonuclease McrA
LELFAPLMNGTNLMTRTERDRARYQRNRKEWLRRSNARNTRVRDEIRLFLTAYLIAHPCVDCGEADARVLDFDHVGEKSFGISTAIANSLNVETVGAEIAKCEVRCANCHRRRTYETRGYRSREAA